MKYLCKKLGIKTAISKKKQSGKKHGQAVQRSPGSTQRLAKLLTRVLVNHSFGY